jgi:tRNA1Val (adenine37-N6)-methyltransferase
VTPGTKDTLFGGRLKLAQPARGAGYRVNVDALLLAEFARCRGRARVAFDLGSGVGAVSLALLHHDAVERVTLVELDEHAAELARDNLAANGWTARGDVLATDVAAAARAHRGRANLVVCNPPYVAPGRGREASGAARARARSGDLASFVDAARVLLGRRGRACFVYPAGELVTFVETLRARGLEPKRARPVRADARSPARVILVEAMAAKRGGLVLERDLIERHRGEPSSELRAIVAGSVPFADEESPSSR